MHLRKRCLDTNGSNSRFAKQMVRCIEHNFCYTSSMDPDKVSRVKGWHIKRNPAKERLADFDCVKTPLNDPNRKTRFINKPVGVVCIIVKNPSRELFKKEKHETIEHFGEDCVEWFVNEILEKKNSNRLFSLEVGLN